MDLLAESKKSNKDAFVSLVDKNSVIFYKIAKLYFNYDKDIQVAIETSLLNTFHYIINCKNERSFLCTAIKDLIQTCELNSKNLPNNDTSDPEIANALLKNAKYRMYKSDSLIEKSIAKLDKENRLIALLYFYANLSVKEICGITNYTKLGVQKVINMSRPILYDILNNLED